MITTWERDEFVRKIQAWKCLGVEEQDNVISKALERYLLASQSEVISMPVRWLLSAAKLIKHEVHRERQKRNEKFAAFVEPRSLDRHKNGVPFVRDRVATQDALTIEGATRCELACQQVLDALSPMEREIVELCGIQGIQPAEASRLLSLGRSTTKSRWERLRAKLFLNATLQEAVSCERRVAG